MQRRFAIKGFIARFKPVHNGYLMSVGVLSEQKRAKQSYQCVNDKVKGDRADKGKGTHQVQQLKFKNTYRVFLSL